VAVNLLCSSDTCRRQIGLLFGARERLDSLFKSSDSKISGYTRPHVIGDRCGFIFSTLESGLILFRIRSLVWTIAVSGKKKLRIQKYPDTCGRGLTDRRLTACAMRLAAASLRHLLEQVWRL